MELYYEGVNISSEVGVAHCWYTDRCGERCDSLELVLENPTTWYGWAPKTDDKIVVTSGELSTGTLYLNTIMPQGNKFRLVATSVPCQTRYTTYKTYENMSLENIMASCAAECGMTNALYGVDGDTTYPFLLREMKSGAAFMRWLLEMEGAVYKTFNKRFIGIGVEYAQALDAALTLTVREDQPGLRYRYREGAKLAGITIKTPYANCTAEDSTAKNGNYTVITNLPATSAAEAARWAHNLLLQHNRQTEELCLETEMLPAMTAMARVDITCNSSLAGQWLVDEVKHDMKWQKSSVKLLRRIDTIR